MRNDEAEILARVHPDLRAVVERAMGLRPFRVVEGLRSLERQRQMVAEKKSTTLHSRHLTGHAVDVVDVAGSYADAAMAEIAEAMKQAAGELGVPVEWGGDWRTFKDTPHFQLPFAIYPEGDHVAHAHVRGPVIEGEATVVGETVRPAAAASGIPGWGGVKQALAESRTILGVLVGAAGWVLDTFERGMALLAEAAAWVTQLDPLVALGLVKPAGKGLIAAGLAWVLLRRLQAAYGGKQG